MALTLNLTSQKLLPPATAGATLFSRSDAAFADSGQPPLSLLRFHLAPQRLRPKTLRSLSHGPKIPTLAPGHIAERRRRRLRGLTERDEEMKCCRHSQCRFSRSSSPSSRPSTATAFFVSYSSFLLALSSLLRPSAALVNLRAKSFSFTFLDAPARFAVPVRGSGVRGALQIADPSDAVLLASEPWIPAVSRQSVPFPSSRASEEGDGDEEDEDIIMADTRQGPDSRFPPGFHFNPDDQELILYYLRGRIVNQQLPYDVFNDVNLYEYHPAQLVEKFKEWGENRWYFFSPRDRKYPNGVRPNRKTVDGYWKATGAEKKILSNGTQIGIRKALVFYTGKAGKGTKTDWIMYEYINEDSSGPRRPDGTMKLDDWVLCTIQKKRGAEEDNTSDALEESSKAQATSQSTKKPRTSQVQQIQHGREVTSQVQIQHGIEVEPLRTSQVQIQHGIEMELQVQQIQHGIEMELQVQQIQHGIEVEPLRTSHVQIQHGIEMEQQVQQIQHGIEVEPLRTSHVQIQHGIEMELLVQQLQHWREVEPLRTSQFHIQPIQHEVEPLRISQLQIQHEVEPLRTSQLQIQHCREVESLRTSQLQIQQIQHGREVELLNYQVIHNNNVSTQVPPSGFMSSGDYCPSVQNFQHNFLNPSVQSSMQNNDLDYYQSVESDFQENFLNPSVQSNDPGYFPSAQNFQQNFLNPSEQSNDLGYYPSAQNFQQNFLNPMQNNDLEYQLNQTSELGFENISRPVNSLPMGQYQQDLMGQYQQDLMGQYQQDPMGQYEQDPMGQYEQDPLEAQLQSIFGGVDRDDITEVFLSQDIVYQPSADNHSKDNFINNSNSDKEDVKDSKPIR